MCGIAGNIGSKEAANLVDLMLYKLQNRGQEGAGMVASDGDKFKYYRGKGLVANVFKKKVIGHLSGNLAIGHVRYSTTGGSTLKNLQPFVAEDYRGTLAVAHNGNLVNAGEIRHSLEEKGTIFYSSSDSEIIPHLMAHSREERLTDRVIEALGQVQGSYSLLIATKDRLIAARDPYGFRPLVLGRLNQAYVVASESLAFDLIGVESWREIEPGEVVVISRDGIKSHFPFPKPKHLAHCIFELIYFSNPDSIIFGQSVYQVRKKLGYELGKNEDQEFDYVSPVPDSSNAAALGVAQFLEKDFEFALIRNHYIGRTFIEPQASIRHFGVKLKLNPVRSLVQGKRVCLVDDSIVRGVTSGKVVDLLWKAGAKEVHLRSSCPPVIGPCYYGIDIPTLEELIAHQCADTEAIRRKIGATSLRYQTLQGLFEAVGDRLNYCSACLGGSPYPVKIPEYLLNQNKNL